MVLLLLLLETCCPYGASILTNSHHPYVVQIHFDGRRVCVLALVCATADVVLAPSQCCAPETNQFCMEETGCIDHMPAQLPVGALVLKEMIAFSLHFDSESVSDGERAREPTEFSEVRPIDRVGSRSA